MEKDITRQVENVVDYYKNTDNLEEIPIDILRAMYKDNLSELETYKKIAEKLAEEVKDYANLEIVVNCPAEYEGKYDMSKCRNNHLGRNCVQCIIDWARKEVENENS